MPKPMPITIVSIITNESEIIDSISPNKIKQKMTNRRFCFKFLGWGFILVLI